MWIRSCCLSAAALACTASVASADLLYAASRDSDEILRYDSETAAFVDVFVAPGSGGLEGPRSLTFGPDGHLYVGNGTGDILRYDGSTGAPLGVFVDYDFTIAGRPVALEFGPDGDLYVIGSHSSITGSSSLTRYDGTTGALLGTVFSWTGSHRPFKDLEFGPDGTLYVLVFRIGIIRLDASTLTFQDLFVSFETTVPQSLFNERLEIGHDGHLYVTAFGGLYVLRYDGDTGAFIDRFIEPQGPFAGAGSAGIALGPDADWFVAPFRFPGDGPSRIRRFDKLTGDLVEVIDAVDAATLQQVTDLVFEPRRATSYGCGVNPAGSLTAIGGSPALGSALVLGIDNPLGTQAPGSLAVAFLSTAPDPSYPCGTLVAGLGMAPGPGELLVDVQPPNPVLPLLIGPPWAGPGMPAALPLAIPPIQELALRRFYLQGALIDPSLAMAPRLRLTGALAIEIGL